MTTTAQPEASRPPSRFRHEALFYAGPDEFVERAVSFLRDAIDAGEAALTVVDDVKVARLHAALGGDADGVEFADMATVGRNPAQIIAVWHEFAQRHAGAGRAVRGIGEPMWAGRSVPAQSECQQHELLLNVAFANGGSFWLLCPYDTATLPSAVIADACASHPYVSEAGTSRPSDHYRDPAVAPLAGSLPDPTAPVRALDFDVASLRAVRRLAASTAQELGFAADRVADVALAINEIATNSVRHGGGAGTLRVWEDGGTLVCEVRDHGRVSEPLAGRLRPEPDQVGGFGLWLANRICDLVQLRSDDAGTVVRLHLSRTHS